MDYTQETTDAIPTGIVDTRSTPLERLARKEVPAADENVQRLRSGRVSAAAFNSSL
jgi:hypothetical protein